MKNIFKPGFTLIELLVVISVIGILAALLLASFAGIRDRADDAKVKSNMKQMQTALRLYYNDNQSYPADADCKALSLATYMEDVDSFPDSCEYSRITTDTFKACVSLANSADKDIEAAGGKCGDPIIGVTNPFCVCSN